MLSEGLLKFSKEYRAGTLLTGHLKARCIQELQLFVADFQEVLKFSFSEPFCVLRFLFLPETRESDG